MGKGSDRVYLSLLNPVTNEVTNGFPIIEEDYYLLEENQICTVQVEFQDGTLELEEKEVIEFLNVERGLEVGEIFYRIKRFMVFGFPDPIKECEEHLEDIFIDVINRTKYE